LPDIKETSEWINIEWIWDIDGIDPIDLPKLLEYLLSSDEKYTLHFGLFAQQHVFFPGLVWNMLKHLHFHQNPPYAF